MNLIVSAAIVLLNPYVTIYISYKIPPFALSVHIPDVSTSIYVEVCIFRRIPVQHFR